MESGVENLKPAEKLGRVLVVEDDPDIRLVVEVGLGEVAGLEVRVACNGRAALDILEQWRPDLILSDVVMPEMTGVQLVDALDQDSRYAAIPVVLMTARSEQRELDSYLDLGVLHVFAKPFDPMNLAEKLSGLYLEWRQRQ